LYKPLSRGFGRKSRRASRSSQRIEHTILVAVGAAVGFALLSAFRKPAPLNRRQRRQLADAARHSHDPAPVDFSGRASQNTAHLTRPSDATLEARVLDVFLVDPVLQARAIDISASGPNAVELTGWVDDDHEIAYATTLARGVPGVSEVSVNLRSHQRRPRRRSPINAPRP